MTTQIQNLNTNQTTDILTQKPGSVKSLTEVDTPKSATKDVEEVKLSDQEAHDEITSATKGEGVKIAFIGNVDSGKSTLVGVLTKGMFDDGRGSARLRVFNYPHEATLGRTSSVGHEIMGFDEDGKQIFPDRFVQNKNKYWGEIVKRSKKIVTLIDLCGHEKYLKTTMFGLVGMVPDYSMIIVGSNMGISRMTKEHLGITLALKIPFFVVLTKVDMCPDNIFKETMETLMKILKSGGCNRKPVIIKTDEDIVTCAGALATDRICPIFTVSSVTGENVDKLSKFISLLDNRNETNKFIKSADEPAQYDINENFMVSGVGVVVSGVLRSGTIKPGDHLLLGPDKANTFKQIQVRTIHVNRVAAEACHSGQYACLAIKPVNKKDTLSREEFRKGMVLIDPALKPEPIWDFDAEIVILHHATTIKDGYQAVVHCGVIRQAVTIEEMPKDILRTGDKGIVRFRFMYNAEYVKPGLTVLLREGRTKILGVVTKVYDSNEKKRLADQKLEEKKEDKHSK
jgi:GTPase